MGEGVAQSLAVNDSQRRDEIAFDRVIALVDHFRFPSRPSRNIRARVDWENFTSRIVRSRFAYCGAGPLLRATLPG